MGEQMTREILRRLKFDNDTIRMVSRLVLYHDDRPAITDRSVRRIMNRYGEECFPRIFEVQRADVLAQSLYHRQEKLDYIVHFEQQYRAVLEAGQCVKKSDLAINGRDLIELGIPQGKQLGEVLDRLFEQVLDQPELNTREKLLELAHKMMPPFI
jgi:tRNA nucleotidyltransferase (CCA-adding enzyme)